MPGKAIGSYSDPVAETVWRGYVEIIKNEGECLLSKCQAIEQASSDIDLRLHQHLQGFVQELNRPKIDLVNPRPQGEQIGNKNAGESERP